MSSSERVTWRQFWQYHRDVLREAGLPPVRDWIAALVAAVIAAAIEGAMTASLGWLIPVGSGVVAGLLVYSIELARASAVLHKRANRRLRGLAGNLTEDEVAIASQDRKRLQRAAHNLLSRWRDLQDAMMFWQEKEMFAAEAELRSAARDLQELARATDHQRGIDYSGALLQLDILLKDKELHPFNKHDLYVGALKDLERLEHEDRLWVLEHRTFRPPADPPPSESGL